jgi:PAT family beta-lactamase induction signal transducer AmpG
MLTTRKLFIIWLFGSISGFTLLISGNTLNFWLTKEQINLESIGIFAFITIPYAINFIWAPIFDAIKLGFLAALLGKRLSWLCVIQFLLALFIFILSTLSPNDNILIFGIIAFFISFFSSAQDTILGALKTEIVDRELQGAISGIYMFGYRIGMLISGSFAMYLSDYISLQEIYKIFAILVLIFPIILMFSLKESNSSKYPEQSATQKLQALSNLHAQDDTDQLSRPLVASYSLNPFDKIILFLSNILKPIGSWKFVTLVIIFLILYRLPDNFIYVMINPFFIHLGYNAFEIASFGKFLGMILSIIGGLVASFIMKKQRITDSLLIFGLLHAVAHIMFVVQELYGNALWLLCLSNVLESVTGGMAMAAYIAFIASLCSGKYRATQYSFFASMMGLSRSIFPALSGYIVVQLGWINFFTFAIILSIPSLILLMIIRKYV